METNHHVLRRPKRKLCYVTNKKSPSKKWSAKVSLGDIDGMFDDLDSSLHDEDIIPPSPLQSNRSEGEISPEKHLSIKLPVPGGDFLHSARSLSPELNIIEDLNIPFKVHHLKTSSPIEKKIDIEAVGEEDNERALVVPQILDFEEPKKDVNIQNPQCNGHVTEDRTDSELESPLSKVTISKPTMSSHKKQVVTPCKENRSVKEKTPKESNTSVVEVKGKLPRQENTEPAVRQDPECPSPDKNTNVDSQPSAEISTRGGKDIKAFLQKVRDAERTTPACSRGFQSLVKVPTPPPEPEDEFLILEEDAPLIYIPCKSSIRKKQKQTETKAEQSSTDKDSSTDKCTKYSPLKTAQKHDELHKANPKHQPVNQNIKKNKGKERRKEVTGPGNDKDEFPITQDSPTGDLVEQEKPNKRKERLKKVQSKESDKAEKKPKVRAIRETDEETHSQNLQKKTLKSSEIKRSKSSKAGKENAKKKQTEAEDMSSDKEISGSEAQTAKALAEKKAKENKPPVVSAGSSSEDSEVPGKRKRKQPGQWWLSLPQSTEETKVTDNQPTLKKSKQNNKEPRAEEASPVKAKKDRVLKRRNQKQPAPASSENTNMGEVKKTKRNKNRITRGEIPDNRKKRDEAFQTMEVEQIEDHHKQQDVSDQDLDTLDSNPLVLAQRDSSLSSGCKVFQRVYHHDSNEKISSTPAAVSTGRLQQQLEEGKTDKRRRKPPGNWWLVDGVSEHVESDSSQPQQLHRKEPEHHKEKNNQSKRSRCPRLGAPKNGNMAVSSKPRGAPATPALKLKPLSTPKTVKRSLATFKDIFTSATETECVMTSTDTCQRNQHKVSALCAEEVSVLPKTHETPLDTKCPSDYSLKEVISGPSSMIQLEQYEENEDLILPSSRVIAALSISDLCAPPLKPLTLQPKDKANLREWFKSLWPTVAPDAAEITPDQFDWYFYQDRAIGFLLDKNCDTVCVGRIVLGSYMKKPLWVDHSASTVFNLLTSSVNVVIDSRESHFHAGQCFTVQCGHAYSIQNITAQPAVLYFTRILADGPD